MKQKSTLLLLVGMMLALSSAWGQCTDLFFSEYIEGSGNSKAVELYNPTSAPVNLTDYKLLRFNNGSTTPTDSLFPQGVLAAQGVFVIGNSSADPAVLAVSDTTHSLTFYNGDDALALINLVTGDTLDVLGVIGQDPGTNWTVGTGATSEFTLVRMPSVQDGTTDWTTSVAQWLVFPQNTFDSLGTHTIVPCGSTGFGCTTDLFFSEYIEGSGNNKALEIYNPLDFTVDLTDYKLLRYNNGSTTLTDSLFPQGMLAPQEVFVIGNSSADPAVLAQSDTTHTMTFYNGDDALAIVNLVTGDTIDIIGIIGQDPGTNWTVGSGATSEFSLVRMPSVQEGTKDWTLSATQWLVFAPNTFDSLGAHTMLPCNVVQPDPTIAFAAATVTVSEAAGSASFSVALANTTGDSAAVTVMLAASGSATAGSDFTWTDTTIVFPAGNAAPIALSVAIIDDAVLELDETIVFKLMNPTNGALIGMTDSLVVTITDNDATVPYYPIGLLTADADGDGLGDSLGVNCEIRGVVYGVDLQTSANSIQFTLIDPTGGIGVFSSQNFGYTVLEGDSLRIFGTLNQFNGLTQIAPDSLLLASQGNALVAPLVVDSLGEYTESELIRINGVFLSTPSQWPAAGASANVTISNGTTTFTLRIDSDTDVDGSPAPTGFFDVIGLGGQFDSSVPYTSGYQILPRSLADIIDLPDPGFSFVPASLSVDESAGTVSFDVVLGSAVLDTVSVDVMLGTGTATAGADFAAWLDTTLVFTPDTLGPLTLTLDILDDSDVEGAETIVLMLANPTAGTQLVDSVLTISITDNDFAVYPIGLVTADSDGDGQADSIGVVCELRGLVYGVNLLTTGPNGVQFTMRDDTDGIQVFSSSYTGYTVTEGDSIHVRGEIENFNGLAEIVPDTIILISQGNALPAPVAVTTLDETTESEFVTLSCVKLVDPAQWPAAGSNANVSVTDNVSTFTVRIDKETEIDGSTAPTGWLSITGLGNQFDSSYPYNDGYQLFPRFLSDIVVRATPTYAFVGNSTTVSENVGTVSFKVALADLNPDTTSFTVRVNSVMSTATGTLDYTFSNVEVKRSGCGDVDTAVISVTILTDNLTEGDETIRFELVAGANGSPVGDNFIVTITDVVGISDLLPADAIGMYPNPTHAALQLVSTVRMERLRLSDLTGRVLLKRDNLQAVQTQLDLAHLPQGIYLLSVETPAGNWVQRVVKR
ncbi:MAG: hypothetical protein OHK0039_46070 [Bacteroidia bacterium]